MLPIKQIIAFIIILSLFECCSEHPSEPDTPDTLDTVQVDSSLIYPRCIEGDSKSGQFGCFNMFFGRILDEDFRNPTKVIAVTIDPAIVSVTRYCQEYDLPREGIKVEYLVSRQHPDSVYFYYCNDLLRTDVGEPIVYEVLSGKIKIASDIDSVTLESRDFYISAELLDLLFEIDGQKDTTISNSSILEQRQGNPY